MKGSLTDDSTRLGLSQKGKDTNSSFKDGCASFQNQILKSEGKQLVLLKHKCQTLTSVVRTLKAENCELRKQKEKLLAINSEYIESLNKYYEDRNKSIQKVIFPAELWHDEFQLDAKLKEYLKVNIAGFKKLQQDHRNLVQHCLTMQKQIKNYKVIVDQCHKMKDDLLAVNHTSVLQLAKQIQQVTMDNRGLRSQNNRISYEYQKTRKQLDRNKITLKDTERQSQKYKQQLAECKGSINRMVEESKQKANDFEKTIYQLNVKVFALEQQLRGVQQTSIKMEQIKHQHQVDIVEFAYKQAELNKSIIQFTKTKANRANALLLDQQSRSMSVFFGNKPDISRSRRPVRSHTNSTSKYR